MQNVHMHMYLFIYPFTYLSICQHLDMYSSYICIYHDKTVLFSDWTVEGLAKTKIYSILKIITFYGECIF